MPKKQNYQHWTSLWDLNEYLYVLCSDHKLSWSYLEILLRRWLQEAKVAKDLDSNVNDGSNAISIAMQCIQSVDLKALHWRNNFPLYLIQKLQTQENPYIKSSFVLVCIRNTFFAQAHFQVALLEKLLCINLSALFQIEIISVYLSFLFGLNTRK